MALYELEGRAVLAALQGRHQTLLAQKAPHTIDGTDVVPLFRQNPDYPARAFELRIEGWVHLEFDITDMGPSITLPCE